jgi:hypothetical protein
LGLGFFGGDDFDLSGSAFGVVLKGLLLTEFAMHIQDLTHSRSKAVERGACKVRNNPPTPVFRANHFVISALGEV